MLVSVATWYNFRATFRKVKTDLCPRWTCQKSLEKERLQLQKVVETLPKLSLKKKPDESGGHKSEADQSK
jgi:hypothetical protein